MTQRVHPGPSPYPNQAFLDRYRARTNGEILPVLRRRGLVERGVVYVVGFHEYVKIGFTTELKKRIAALQTSCPRRLQVHLKLIGSMRDEQLLHARFKPYRLKNEWFSNTGDLAAWVEKEKAALAALIRKEQYEIKFGWQTRLSVCPAAEKDKQLQ